MKKLQKIQLLADLYRAAQNGDKITIDAALLTPAEVERMAAAAGVPNVADLLFVV